MVSENRFGDSIDASPFFGKKGGYSINELAAQRLTIKSPII